MGLRCVLATHARRKLGIWSFLGILIDPLCGQSYNLAAVENSAGMR